MHHIQLGTALGGTRVRMLIHDLNVLIINRDTGEILRELTINPNKDSQPRGLKPGPKPGNKKAACPRDTSSKNKEVPRHPIRMSRDFTKCARRDSNP